MKRDRYPDRLNNPHRIGLTDAERAVFVPGTAVKTNGVKNWTEAHMNLTVTMRDRWGWLWSTSMGPPDAST